MMLAFIGSCFKIYDRKDIAEIPYFFREKFKNLYLSIPRKIKDTLILRKLEELT